MVWRSFLQERLLSQPLQLQVDFPSPCSQGVPCFSFVAFTTVYLNDYLLICWIFVFPTRFSWRQASYIHYCCSDTQHNDLQIGSIFLKCVDLIRVFSLKMHSLVKGPAGNQCGTPSRKYGHHTSGAQRKHRWSCQEACGRDTNRNGNIWAGP